MDEVRKIVIGYMTDRCKTIMDEFRANKGVDGLHAAHAANAKMTEVVDDIGECLSRIIEDANSIADRYFDDMLSELDY